MTTGDAAELCRPYDTGEAWGQREIAATRQWASQVRLMSYHLRCSHRVMVDQGGGF